MKFKKLSKIEKWYLKYTDRKKYKDYKHKLHLYRTVGDFLEQNKQLEHTTIHHNYKAETAFKHSGNSGDIIYSLPAAFELAKAGKLHFYLHINQPGTYDNYHPLGNVMMNEKIAAMLTPLLLHQPQIEAVKSYNGEQIDYDLDEFRKYPILMDRGSIVRWYAYVYGINYNTYHPWLIAPFDEQYSQRLVIARSHRYRSPVVDYSFLKAYPNKLFVGVPEEYEDMKQQLPDLEFKPVKDFLEMATIINSCKLFIGNQSFPYSIAEALKAPRLLEVFYRAPNVVVEGKNGGDFMYQPQFEYQVKQRMKAEL